MSASQPAPDPSSGSSSKEVPLSRHIWIRQSHRWVSMAFTLAVVVNIVAFAMEVQAVWVGLLALLPLAFLMCTGLYLFFLPYTARWRSGQRTD